MPNICRYKRGYNLIETALVLGIVSVVIGGIWYSASAVKSYYRIKTAAEQVLTVRNSLKDLLQPTNFPTYSGGYWGINSTVYNAGMYPPDFTFISGGAISPEGIGYNAFTVCWGPYGGATCPLLNITVGVNDGALTTAECTTLLRRVATTFRDRSDLGYIQLGSPTSYLYPPIDGSTIACISTTTLIQFFFRP